MTDPDFREIERDRDDRLADEAGEASSAAAQEAAGRYAVFTRTRGSDGLRRMHSVRPGDDKTTCGLPIGVGSGLVRDGDYAGSRPCGTCWS